MSERLDRELSLRGIVGFTIGLLLVIVVAAAALWGLASWLKARSVASDPSAPALREARQPHQPPAPRLQTDPLHDLDELRAAEDRVLEGWGWVDRNAKLARVPVEKAMELYLAGARAGTPTQPAPSEPTETEAPPAAASPEEGR